MGADVVRSNVKWWMSSARRGSLSARFFTPRSSRQPPLHQSDVESVGLSPILASGVPTKPDNGFMAGFPFCNSTPSF